MFVIGAYHRRIWRTLFMIRLRSSANARSANLPSVTKNDWSAASIPLTLDDLVLERFEASLECKRVVESFKFGVERTAIDDQNVFICSIIE